MVFTEEFTILVTISNLQYKNDTEDNETLLLLSSKFLGFLMTISQEFINLFIRIEIVSNKLL